MGRIQSVCCWLLGRAVTAKLLEGMEEVWSSCKAGQGRAVWWLCPGASMTCRSTPRPFSFSFGSLFLKKPGCCAGFLLPSQPPLDESRAASLHSASQRWGPRSKGGDGEGLPWGGKSPSPCGCGAVSSQAVLRQPRCYGSGGPSRQTLRGGAAVAIVTGALHCGRLASWRRPC